MIIVYQEKAGNETNLIGLKAYSQLSLFSEHIHELFTQKRNKNTSIYISY